MRKTVTMTAVGVAAGLVLGFGIPAVGQDEADPGEETAQGQELGEDVRERFDQLREDRLEEFASRLAEELGLETATVRDALEAVREDLEEEWADARAERLTERLAQAVQDGDLTREQADAILAAVEAGVLGDGHPGRGWGPGGHGRGMGHGMGHGIGYGIGPGGISR